MCVLTNVDKSMITCKNNNLLTVNVPPACTPAVLVTHFENIHAHNE